MPDARRPRARRCDRRGRRSARRGGHARAVCHRTRPSSSTSPGSRGRSAAWRSADRSRRQLPRQSGAPRSDSRDHPARRSWCFSGRGSNTAGRRRFPLPRTIAGSAVRARRPQDCGGELPEIYRDLYGLRFDGAADYQSIWSRPARRPQRLRRRQPSDPSRAREPRAADLRRRPSTARLHFRRRRRSTRCSRPARCRDRRPHLQRRQRDRHRDRRHGAHDHRTGRRRQHSSSNRGPRSRNRSRPATSSPTSRDCAPTPAGPPSTALLDGLRRTVARFASGRPA